MANAHPVFTRPVGTLAELERDGFLDPASLPTCAKPSKDDHIVGCEEWFNCPLRGGKAYDYDFKGEVIRGQSGPQAFGIQTLAKKTTGSKVLNRPAMCWELPGLEAQAQASRQSKYSRILRIVAREGDTIDVATHGPVDEDVPGQGKVRTWHPTVVKTLIKPFPRPSANPRLHGDQFTASEATKFFEQHATERAGEFFGRVVTEAVKPEVPTEGDDDGPKRKGGANARG